MNIFEEGLLRYLTRQQLQQIQSKKIGIGGVGGLGSNVAIILTRSGFKNFEILDLDMIDASNLNRQQYFINEIGQSKTEVMRKRLLKINPDIQIKTHTIHWEPEMADQFFQDADYIIEAFDKVEYKHAFVNFYHDKVEYLVSGIGMAGLTQKDKMQVKKIGNIFICGDIKTDTACGHPPMAPRVTQCAAMMAEIILDLSLGLTSDNLLQPK